MRKSQKDHLLRRLMYRQKEKEHNYTSIKCLISNNIEVKCRNV